MTHNDTSISNERLAEMLAGLEGEGKLSHQSVLRSTIRAIILELQALRSTSLEVEPVAWRCEDLILPYISIIEDWEHAQMRMSQPKAWRVTPLYAHPLPNPSPSDGEVSEDLRAAIADAIASAEIGFNMSLVRLVDGVHTYTLKYTDGETLEFCDDETDDYDAQGRLYAHVRARKRQLQAEAVLAAIQSSKRGQP